MLLFDPVLFCKCFLKVFILNVIFADLATQLPQQLANGLVLGSIYALIALGYTMVYGIMQLINFAHGEIVMIASMLSITFLHLFGVYGLPPVFALILTLLCTIPLAALLGYSIERIAYRPLRHAPKLAPLISAIGVSIVLQNVAQLIWGTGNIAFPMPFSNLPFSLWGASITPWQVLILITASVMMLSLFLLIEKTQLGRAMRACAQAPKIAGLMGINLNKIVASTFMLGSALGGVAAILVAGNYGLTNAQIGFMLGLKAFCAAVLGGIGNIRGAMLGGLLLGMIETLGAGYLGTLTDGLFGSQYQDVFAFLVLILVLTLRPNGLLGEKQAERA